MNKFSLILLVLLPINCVIAQITTLKFNTEKTTTPIIEHYDSLESLNFQNAKLHIGQTIYFKKNKHLVVDAEIFPSLYYLYTKPNFGFDGSDYLYKPNQKGKKESTYEFKYCDYNQIMGKYFYVNNIISNDNPQFSGDKDKWSLELIETISRDTAYLIQENLNTLSKYFLTVGYFEKLKKFYVGKIYFYVPYVMIFDFNNGLGMYIPEGTELKCIDLSIKDDGDNNIIAILENSKYGKSFVDINEIKDTYIAGGLETLEAHNAKIAKEQLLKNAKIARNQLLIKKYGQQIANLIINEKVKIGFTKKMCLDSWGEPETINTTTGSFGTHEQWVYDNSYLYFENGKLTAIQN